MALARKHFFLKDELRRSSGNIALWSDYEKKRIYEGNVGVSLQTKARSGKLKRGHFVAGTQKKRLVSPL